MIIVTWLYEYILVCVSA